jgi:predicted ester cyclase
MKQLLVFIFIASVAASCGGSGGSGGGTANGPDSLANMRAAKDSMLEKNKATALASEQAFSSGKIDEMFKDVAADVVDYGDGSSAPVKNIDTVKASVKMWLSAFPDYKGENFLVVAEGNHVAVFGDWSGTFKNAMMGMKPTGKSFKVKDVDLFTFNDAGKITEHRGVQPFANILVQISGKMK